MNPPRDPQTPRVFHAGWFLAAPWMLAVLVLMTFASGAARLFSQLMPFGLGRYAQQNVVWGLLLFTIACSALWARRRARAKGRRDDELIGYIVGTTIWLTFAQALAMAGVFFVGCSFVILSKL